jgi:hypothetical protein
MASSRTDSKEAFDLEGKRLRNGLFGSYRYTEASQTSECVELCILVDTKSLAPISFLFPHVKCLYIRLCGDFAHDLLPLSSCKELKNLTITRWWDEESTSRLKNLSSLVLLHLESLYLFGQRLDPENPIFEWPHIRNPLYLHIKGIINCGSAITYDLDLSKLPSNAKKVLQSISNEDENEDESVGEFEGSDGTENIIVQRFGDSFQVIFRYFEGNHGDSLEVKSITRAAFQSLVAKDPPSSNEELWMPDVD